LEEWHGQPGRVYGISCEFSEAPPVEWIGHLMNSPSAEPATTQCLSIQALVTVVKEGRQTTAYFEPPALKSSNPHSLALIVVGSCLGGFHTPAHAKTSCL
jgi:hypothetical protein